MIRVIGLDPSTSSFGVTLPDGSCRTIIPKAQGTPMTAEKNARRLHEILWRLDAYLGAERPDIVMIEQPIPPRFATAALRLGEMRGVVFARLFERSIPFVEVHNGVLKKFATGNGRASKEEVEDAARACGAEVVNDDESDAWWLWAVAKHHYNPSGWEPSYRAADLRDLRGGIHRKLAWPAIDMATADA